MTKKKTSLNLDFILSQLPIVLVGMPGAGKSVVGKEVANLLQVPFIDVDAEIEFREGRPIGEIFATSGEPYFRQIEEDLTCELVNQQKAVISLGGGAVLSSRIRQAIEGLNVVWLQVSVVHATRRIGMNQLRPLLLGDVRNRLEILLQARTSLYQQVATMQVETDELKVSEVAQLILNQLTKETDGTSNIHH